MFSSFSGHRIVTASAPGVTTCYPFYRQPPAFDNSVLQYGLNGILRAGGCIPAAGMFEGRDAVAVEIDRKKHDMTEDLFYFHPKPAISLFKPVLSFSSTTGNSQHLSSRYTIPTCKCIPFSAPFSMSWCLFNR